MQLDIRHSPSFAVARATLGPNERINAEAGAMYQQSLGIQVDSHMQGGLWGGIKRAAFGGDSFFVSEFIAPASGGWVDLVPVLAGDIFAMNVEPGNDVVLTKGSWIASEQGVTLDTKFGGTSNFLIGEGLFVVKASGRGKVIAAAYGAIDTHSLKQGEGLTIDTGHLVAYEAGMRTNIRKVSTSLLSTFKSGEGLVMDIYGPGDVVTQTRNPSSYRQWIRSIAGGASNSTTPRETGAGNILGGLFS